MFDLRLQRGRAELLPGKPADTWGANGAYLGPTLRAERGDPVEVRVRNGLPETTTIFVVGRAEDARVVGHAHSEGRS